MKNKLLFEIKLQEEFELASLIIITNKNNFPNYATSELINLIENKKGD